MQNPGTEKQGTGPKLLIVDDTPLIRKKIREILENGGYEVIGEAEDGDEAIEMARQMNPDIIIMDYVMKRVDGVSATSVITSGKRGPKVVMVTQSPSPSLVVDSIRAGAINFIIKPFEEKQLLNVVRNLSLS